MEARKEFTYILKRKQEIEPVPEQVKKKIMIKPTQNPIKPSQASKKQHTKACPNLVDFEVKMQTNYNNFSEEKRLIMFAEDVALQLKAKVIELYQDHPLLKEAGCYMLETFISNSKAQQVEYYRSRREKEEEILRERECLADVLMKEREIWNKVVGIYLKSPRNISPLSKIRHLDQIQLK